MTTDAVTPLLRGALVPTLAVGAAAVGVGAAVAGQRGAVGALLGLAVVVVFSGAGLLAVRAVRQQDPMTAMTIALGSYALRVVLFGAALALLGTRPEVDRLLDRTATALTVCVCVAAWLAGEIRAFGRLRIPIYDLDAADRDNTALDTADLDSAERDGTP